MNAREQGFLLLTSKLGNPDRRTMTVAQLRRLAARIATIDRPAEDRELHIGDLLALGFDRELAGRIVALLEETDLLHHYLRRAWRMDCYPITRVSGAYPNGVRQRLGLDSPGCLWAKGDITLLETPKLALVGSRDLRVANREFAREAGRQAALQGYTLVSGNARGADRVAQEACLEQGGCVISVVADQLDKQPLRKNVLYLSEEDFDEGFSPARALSRNRVIHALGQLTLVAQATLERGGSWDGAVRNLHNGWSPVFCFNDASPAFTQLVQLGASGVNTEDLADLGKLRRSGLQMNMEELL